jgi:hypothetical protein
LQLEKTSFSTSLPIGKKISLATPLATGKKTRLQPLLQQEKSPVSKQFATRTKLSFNPVCNEKNISCNPTAIRKKIVSSPNFSWNRT